MDNLKDSLWVEKYRPQTISDIVAPSSTEKMLTKIVETGELTNIMFYGSAGLGKTATARSLVKDLNADELYINGSLETSVDVIRNRVMQFAMTHSVVSLDDEKNTPKIVIIDEAERMSSNAQDSLKVILEEASSNCRFIFCTNNLQKIIDPLQSRCKLISFNYGSDQTNDIMVKYFKRMCYILKNEGYSLGKDEKKILAEFVKSFFPDFRKMINELQGYLMESDSIEIDLLSVGSATQIEELIKILKDKQYTKMQNFCTELDASSFFSIFYEVMRDKVKKEAIPDVVDILCEGMDRHSRAVDQTLNLVWVCQNLMMNLNGKWL